MNWIELTPIGKFPTSISESSQTIERVYPNPVKDQLFIETQNNGGKTEVSILDLSGRLLSTKIFNGQASRMEIDVSGLGSGSYIVRTKNSGNIVNHLIVK